MGRDSEEVHQEMFAIVQVQSDLSDTNDSAIANAVLKATADQFEQAEDLIERSLLRGLGIEAEGTGLDDVVAQWPEFEGRRGASPAQGAVLEFTRDSSVGTLAVDAGSVFASEGGANILLGAGIIFLDGSLTYPAVGQSYGYAISVLTGEQGNVGVGAIRRVVRAPEGVVGVRNVTALTNGRPRETDAQLRRRFLDYLAGGIGRMTERGVIALARAFADQGVRHASIWVDPVRPYAELVLSDGRGFAGLTRTAIAVSGVVPKGGKLDFHCDSPVVDDEVTLKVNGVPVSPVQWTLRHESGRAWLDESAQIWAEGDTWEVSGHQCYAGVIARVQGVINGLLAWQGRMMGVVSVAARIRAITSIPEDVEYDVYAVYGANQDPDAVDAQIRAVIEAFHLDIGQGNPLILLRLNGQLDRIPSAANIHLRDRDDPSVEMEDVYPSSWRHELTTQAGLIRINGRYGG